MKLAKQTGIFSYTHVVKVFKNVTVVKSVITGVQDVKKTGQKQKRKRKRMFSVVFGVNHPRLCEELPKDRYEFFDIGESEASTLILKNLINEVLNHNNSPKLEIVYEDFCKDRALSNENNLHHNKIYNIFVEYQKWYTGSKTSAIKMYLVKRQGNKVVNIYNRWETYRKKPEFVPTKRKKKKSL